MSITIHKTLRGFTDLKDNNKVYKKDSLYVGDSDDPRTKELKGKNNKHKAQIIKPLTKAELIAEADKRGVEVNDKMTVPELNAKIEGVDDGQDSDNEQDQNTEGDSENG